MAVDTLFNDVRLLLQSGGLTNAATSSPATVSSAGVTPGAALTFSSSGVITASGVALANPALATVEMVVTPTWEPYSKIASMLGVSLNAVSAGVIGIYFVENDTATLAGSLTTAQSGEVTLIAEYILSGTGTEIKLTAIPLSGSTTTVTVSASTPSGSVPATLILGGTPSIPVPVPGGSATVARVQAPRASYSQQQIASLRNTNPSNSVIYDPTPVSVTATAVGVSHTYTVSNPANRTVDDVLSELSLGISQLTGAVLMAETGYFTGAEQRASLRLTFTPISSDVDNWEYSFVGMPYATAIYFLTGVYGANPPLSQISTATYTFTPGTSSNVSLTAYGVTTAGSTANMAAFVAAVSSALSTLATVSAVYPFAGQCIVYVTGAVGVEFTLTAALTSGAAVSSGIATLAAARVTSRRRYIDSGETVEYPSLPWPTTSIPTGGGSGPISSSEVYLKFEDGAGSGSAANSGVTGGPFSVSPHAIVSSQHKDGAGSLQLTGAAYDVMSFGSVTGPGTGDYTAEMWVKFPALPGSAAVFVSPYTRGFALSASGAISLFTDNGASSLDTTAGAVSANVWYHIAAVRLSGTVKFYFNGVSQEIGASGQTGSVGAPLSLGEDGSYGSGVAAFIDEYRFTNAAVYTADFTPASPLEYPIPSGDTSLAGYNDIDSFIGDGTFNLQATQPDVYFFSSATADDVVATGDAYTLNSDGIAFTSSRTISGVTNTGTFVRDTPQNFDSTITLDDTTAASTFYCDVPVEWIGDSTLADITCFGIHALMAPSMLSGDSSSDDVTSSAAFGIIDPIYFRLAATVPIATLTSSATQFFVNAQVPAATLLADVASYDGISLDASVPVAGLSSWMGMSLSSQLPRVTLLAETTVPNTLRIDAMLPGITGQGNILPGRVFSVSSSVPAASISSWTGLQLAASVPTASSAGNVVVGGAFRVSPGMVPMATMAAGASSMNVLRLNGAVPAASRAGWVAVNRNVPSARMLGSITPVVAVTRVAYSFTLANSAMTRYPAYPFIQVIRIGNAYYGIGEDGLYELGGTTDNGVSIPWSWETCMADFGQAEKKTVVSAYLGGYVPQSMAYTIKAGDLPTGTNAHTTTATAVLRNHRQKFGIGRKSRFFAFGLSATQGRVAIESIEFEMASMSRRV